MLPSQSVFGVSIISQLFLKAWVFNQGVYIIFISHTFSLTSYSYSLLFFFSKSGNSLFLGLKFNSQSNISVLNLQSQSFGSLKTIFLFKKSINQGSVNLYYFYFQLIFFNILIMILNVLFFFKIEKLFLFLGLILNVKS